MAMAFSPTSGLRDTTEYPTVPASETAAREQIQGRLDELKFYNNKHGVFVSDTGTADTMGVTLSTDVISDTDLLLLVTPNANNATSAVTLNVNALGGVQVYKYSTQPLLQNDIVAGSIAILGYSTANTAYELLNPKSAVSTTGGTQYQNFSINATTDGVQWQASLQSLMTAQGDIVYASGANTPAKLAKGTARQGLLMNSGATVPEWGASMQSVLTAGGDIIYASGANTPARLAKGTAYQHLGMNSGATAPEWQNSANSVLTAQSDLLYASAANTLARLAKGTAGQILKMNSGATAPEWSSASVASGEDTDTTSIGGSSTYTMTVALGLTGDFGVAMFKNANALGCLVFFNTVTSTAMAIWVDATNDVEFRYGNTLTDQRFNTAGNADIYINDVYIDGTDLKVDFVNTNVGAISLNVRYNYCVWQ